jgi:hypothetical protein
VPAPAGRPHTQRAYIGTLGRPPRPKHEFYGTLSHADTRNADAIREGEDAERVAQTLRKAYANADASEKSKHEKTTGLSGTELKDLTGKR